VRTVRLNSFALASLLAVMPLQQRVDSALAEPRAEQPAMAAAEGLLVNVVINRFDAWIFQHDWAMVRPSDWSRNLRLGWEWDEDSFGTNMFSHPYHGGLYFNTARSNGLEYWEAIPFAFLGSFTWEYFGERYRPSLNDFIMTSFGGITLGEVFHRIGASIRDNTAAGGQRTLREIAALPFDPIAGFNRLVRGEWNEAGPNPAEHTPQGYLLRISTGARFAADSGFVDQVNTTSSAPTLIADLVFGDPIFKPYARPFEVLAVRAQLSQGGAGGLNRLHASGRVYARNINRAEARHRHVFAVNQRYDYLNNPAHRFGAQSVELGIHSRWRLSRTTALRTQAFVDGIVLGALDAPLSGAGERTYDFGPGVGFRTAIEYERNGITYAVLRGRTEYVHSVSGAEADHVVGFGGLEVTVPLVYDLGVGFHTAYYRRRSRYSDQPEEAREFPEVRLFLTWTAFRPTGR
jgi:hypothetical protein